MKRQRAPQVFRGGARRARGPSLASFKRQSRSTALHRTKRTMMCSSGRVGAPADSSCPPGAAQEVGSTFSAIRARCGSRLRDYEESVVRCVHAVVGFTNHRWNEISSIYLDAAGQSNGTSGRRSSTFHTFVVVTRGRPVLCRARECSSES